MKLFLLLFCVSILSISHADQLKLNDNDRVAFVGGTFVEREAEYSLIETYLTIANQDKNITFRNLGWAADTVKGESRGYFKIEEGYGLLLQKVRETNPTVIVLAYGSNASWNGKEGLQTFIADYTKLIKDLQERTKARIILMSTPRQENLGTPYPDPKKHNTDLELYFSEISKLASKLKLEYIDVFNSLKDVKGLTTNSIHLNKKGYHEVALFLSGIAGERSDTVFSIDVAKGEGSASRGKMSDISSSSKQVSFTYKAQELGSFLKTNVLKISGLKEGEYELKANGRTLLKTTAKELAKGINNSELMVQEKLLQTEILEKNEQFFHSWRPQNTTYLFGFRKHEQGQNGKEIKEFAAFIKEHEAKIQQLKKLTAIKWEIVPRTVNVAKRKEQKLKLVLPPEEEIKTFNLPEDLEVSLFAAEPMVVNPTNMNWDTQGRLWVACTPDYPQIKPGHMASDQIVVLVDTDKDGKADKHHVFVDNVLIPTAVIPGNGGVYVANSTELIHYKDTDGDMKADEKNIIMSGFGTEDTHHIIHTPYWGQDGMLYFSQSIYIHSHVETPWGVERLMAGGIWQYNPHTEKLKVFSRGLINTWGHRMDKYGQSFATDGAGSHGINYIFPGVAQRTAYGTRHIYPGLNPGQPKHCGLEIISGSHFPEKYQGLLVANDFRGHRANSFKITENGSAFLSNQQTDIISTGSGKIDRKGEGGGFRPVDVKMGPDGALYFADWSNIIIQHGEVDFRDERRDQTHGRIWRVTAKGQPLSAVKDFSKASIPELLDNLKSDDRYITDMSKRVLIEHGSEKVIPKLTEWLSKGQSDYSKLQALWLRVGINSPDVKLLREVLLSSDYRIRAAAVRIGAQQYSDQPDLLDIFKSTIKDKAPIVRLETVNALRVIESAEAVEVALQAIDNEVDPTIDYALVLTVREMEDDWIGKTIFNGNIKHLTYAVNASRNPKALESLYSAYKAGKISQENQGEALKLIAELGNAGQLTELYNLCLTESISIAAKKAVLASLFNSSRTRGIKPKANLVKLGELIKTTELKTEATSLIGEWKVKQLIPSLLPLALKGDDQTLDALGKIKGPEAQKVLLKVIEKNHHNQSAIKAIATLANVNIKAAVDHSVKQFQNASNSLDYGPIFESVLKHKDGPKKLNDALQGKRIDSSIALLGVQRANIGGRDLSYLISTLNKAGDLKPMKTVLSPEELKAIVKAVEEKGNPHLGENIYRKQSIACMACHAIGGAGPEIGPDLISIGASAPVDYLIESILQPSKKIKEGYHMTMVATKDGQMIAGSEVSANKEEVVIRDAQGKVTKIPARNIKKKHVNPMSMMPPGLAASLSEEEFIHMIAFLSELGKDGDFKTSSKRYIRTFDVVKGFKYQDIDKPEKFNVSKAYAKVNGSIPVTDKSLFPSSHKTIKFDLEVIKEGTLTLKLSSANGLKAFTTTKERLSIDEAKNLASIKVNKGQIGIVLMLSKAFTAKNLTIEISESNTDALVKLK